MVYLLFGIAALLLVGVLALLWQLWDRYARLSPEEEEYEREIASLNDAQANRLSDKQIARQIDTAAGWEIMVGRGGGGRRTRRDRRPRR